MTTPILGLAEIVESQASKYLTHNQANRVLEAVMFGVVKSRTTAAEPATFADGDIYILPASPTGASWAGFAASDIVVAVGGGWQRITPNTRMRLHKYVEDNDAWTLWDGTVWLASSAPGGGGTVAPPTGTFRYVRWTITEAPAHGVGYQLAVVNEFQIYETPTGADVAPGAGVTAPPFLTGYGDGTAMTDGSDATNYANGQALPAVIVFDFGGSPIAGVDHYAVTRGTGGNAATHPTGWTLEVGNDLATDMTQVDSRTGVTFAADRNEYTPA